jgi:Flp pilus assembly protein TadG
MNMQHRSSSSGCRRYRFPGLVRGQSITEFVIVIPILLLLILGTLQFAMIYIAKATLNQAAMTAARKGAVYNASTCAIRDGLIDGLTPLYGTFNPNSTTANSLSLYNSAHTKANDLITGASAGHLNSVGISILNPSSASFSDFGKTVGNFKEIPSSRLLYRNKAPGTASNQSIQDANLLKIRVHYCYRLLVPFVAVALEKIKSLNPGGSTFDATCYADGGAPIQSDATVLMQSPARQNDSTCP